MWEHLMSNRKRSPMHRFISLFYSSLFEVWFMIPLWVESAERTGPRPGLPAQSSIKLVKLQLASSELRPCSSQEISGSILTGKIRLIQQIVFISGESLHEACFLKCPHTIFLQSNEDIWIYIINFNSASLQFANVSGMGKLNWSIL